MILVNDTAARDIRLPFKILLLNMLAGESHPVRLIPLSVDAQKSLEARFAQRIQILPII